MLTIYGRANSSNVQLAMWAVGELGLAHQRLDYGFGHADTRAPDFLAMNPNGLVPVLKDGDLVLFESMAILRYLAARYGDGAFWPEDPAARAQLDMWAEWGKNSFAPAINTVFACAFARAPARRDPVEIAQAMSRLPAVTATIDARLGQGPWIAGDAFSFADIAVGHILDRYHRMPIERPAAPNLLAYYERLQTRPAYRDHAMVGYEALIGTR